jgi:DNA-binding transcriptional LysR family regulator
MATADEQDGEHDSPNQRRPRIVSTLNLAAAGLGISLVPEPLRRMHMDNAAAQQKAPLYLASRRGETSTAVRKFGTGLHV